MTIHLAQQRRFGKSATIVFYYVSRICAQQRADVLVLQSVVGFDTFHSVLQQLDHLVDVVDQVVLSGARRNV